MYAHRADPDARLVLNDYGAEFQGKAKTTAFYNLVRRLQKSGIPLDGVGFQCHLTVGEEFDSTKFDNNIKTGRQIPYLRTLQLQSYRTPHHVIHIDIRR